MSLERLCRVGNDFPNLKEVILTAARMCRQAEDWPQLNTTLTLLSKRRGQHSKAVTAMVQEVRTGWGGAAGWGGLVAVGGVPTTTSVPRARKRGRCGSGLLLPVKPAQLCDDDTHFHYKFINLTVMRREVEVFLLPMSTTIFLDLVF